VLARGAEKARAIASPTLRLVRQRVGIGSIGNPRRHVPGGCGSSTASL
jgi:hypothetical protein